MAYVRVGMTAALIVVTPLAGQVMDAMGYRATFVVGALAGSGAAVLFANIRGAVFSSVRTSIADIVAILARDRAFAVYSMAFVLVGTGYMLAAPLFPIFQVDRLHLSYGDVGLLSFLNSVVWMVSYIVLGRALDRKGALWIVRLSLVTQAMMPLCYFLARDVWLVALAFFFGGVALAAGDLGWMNGVLLFATPERVPDYAALHSLLAGVRGTVAPLIGAALLGVPLIGMQGVFVLSFVLQIAGWLLSFRVRAPRPATSRVDGAG